MSFQFRVSGFQGDLACRNWKLDTRSRKLHTNIHHYGRINFHIPEEMKQQAIRRARSDDTNRLGKYSILRKEFLDGVKFFLDAPTNGNGADAWILMRASGTEPLLRVYTEASSPELVNEILSSADTFIKQ